MPKCFGCGYIGEFNSNHDVRHYKHQIKNIEAFKTKHAHIMTTRFRANGGEMQVSWGALCSEALDVFNGLLEKALIDKKGKINERLERKVDDR